MLWKYKAGELSNKIRSWYWFTTWLKNEKIIETLQNFGISYFLGKNVFDDNGFQNIFVYQPPFSMLKLKEHKDARYMVAWK